MNVELYKIESLGVLLQENLYTEWWNNIVINKDLQVFPTLNSLSESFTFVKEICSERVPFGLTRITKRKQTFQEQVEKQKNKGPLYFSSFFENWDALETWIFLSPSNATQFFHQWQRERRMWWRKFSASPGRYVLTDIRNEENCHIVEILAKYPWGEQLIETLKLDPEVKKIPSDKLGIKDGKKVIQSYCVTSKIYSSTMLLNTLCDAYDETLFQDQPRPMLRLHRKLAPYKISFSIPSGPKSMVDELKDLAMYLCRQLRRGHISCMLVPTAYKNTLESQWKQYDQMGIPYNLLLNENTLKNGIAQLRSRDTTLKEQIHVTDLPSYVEKLFKNY